MSKPSATLHTEAVLGRYTVNKPIHVAGRLSWCAAQMEHPAFITTSEKLLKKICVDVKRDWYKDYQGIDGHGLDPEQSGEKTLQTMKVKKRFLGLTLLIDNAPAFESAAKLSNFDLSKCYIVELKED